MTKRAKTMVKLIERLMQQDHLYTPEKLKEMKAQLKILKEEIKQIEQKNSKGFGKK